jgi:hypothetical protein
MYRVVDEVQGRFGAFPGAGLLMRQRDTDALEEGAPEGQGGRSRGRNRSANRTEKGDGTS